MTAKARGLLFKRRLSMPCIDEIDDFGSRAGLENLNGMMK